MIRRQKTKMVTELEKTHVILLMVEVSHDNLVLHGLSVGLWHFLIPMTGGPCIHHVPSLDLPHDTVVLSHCSAAS